MRFTVFAALLAINLNVSAAAEVLFQYDFEGERTWKSTSTDVMPSTPIAVEPSIGVEAVGTINKAHTSEASGGLALKAEVGDVTGEWDARFISGLLPVSTKEINLGKLTLSFDLSASVARPITVIVESFDANIRRSGGLQTVIYPPAPDFYQRSAIDLSVMKPSGGGKFNPTDPFIQITYVIAGPSFPANATHTLRIDNVCYATPKYYVSPTGSDSNDGLTEATPLQDPQKAHDLSKPGDIIVLMDGEYRRSAANNEQNGIIHIEIPGEPAGWIVYKNYPGHKPVIINEDSWCAIRLGDRVRLEKYKDIPQAYIEIRGLHIRGGADKVMEKYADRIGLPDPRTNGNGISGGGPRGGVASHHLRVADCIAEYNPGGGIGFGNSDWCTYENNISRYNSWFTIYATSGMGSIGTANFDSPSNVYKTLIRNNRVSWNQTYIIWKKIGKHSDGNGIIIDVNNEPAKNESYLGRTLIQNNICTFNGGSGIHTFKAHQVDIVNNTAFMNSHSVHMEYPQIFANQSRDVRFLNNIAVAPVASVEAGERPEAVNDRTLAKPENKIVWSNNILFGGNRPPTLGIDGKLADPMFVDPWVTPWEDGTMSNFRLKPGSPALGAGTWEAFVPLTDIDGNPRPLNSPPDAGAFQHTPSR